MPKVMTRQELVELLVSKYQPDEFIFEGVLKDLYEVYGTRYMTACEQKEMCDD